MNVGMRKVLGWAVVAACSSPPCAWAAGSEPIPAIPGTSTLLARIQAAAKGNNYQGTLVFSASGNMSSSRIAHYLDGQQSYERVDALDGRVHQVLRHNDQVQTLWPQSRVVVVEQRELRQGLPSMVQTLEPRVEEQYELRMQGVERVAGREAQVVLLRPRDEYRFAQRIWADQRSGLMLRADVLGQRDEVLESSAFSEVEIGVRAQPQLVLQPMKQAEGYRVVKPGYQVTQLEAEGWALSPNVPGFTQASCVRRVLDPAAGPGTGPSDQVLQVVYSDGLTHVSLFVEPFQPERHRRAFVTQLGATHTLMQRHLGQWWVTVMGDVPPVTLKQFVKGLERLR